MYTVDASISLLIEWDLDKDIISTEVGLNEADINRCKHSEKILPIHINNKKGPILEPGGTSYVMHLDHDFYHYRRPEKWHTIQEYNPFLFA